jgi:predicted DsbA family dithiol-disulfide isomerase
VALDWRGFELHPDTPPGGERLADRYGAQRFAAMRGHLLLFAASFGVDGLRVPDRTPNTRAALAVAEHARDRGRLHPFRAAAMDAHWRQGKDLEDPGVLAACAVAAGLEAAEAARAVDDPALRARVDAMGREALQAGVTGIPTLLVGGRRVVGCQPYEVFEAAAVAAGARRR